MREIIVGDIHGCIRAYQSLMKRLRPDAACDRLILLGDLFDRGPDSWEVLQRVMAQAEAFGDRFVLLRGNHEDYLLQPRLTLLQRIVWQRVGRAATVRSFKKHGERMEECVPWLAAHCRLFFKGEGYQCVHAGVAADPLEANDAETLIHDHDIVRANRYDGPLTVTGHIALEEAAWFAGDGETVELISPGETRPLPEKGVLCIDTGCGKGGKLTAMVIENGLYTLHSTPES